MNRFKRQLCELEMKAEIARSGRVKPREMPAELLFAAQSMKDDKVASLSADWEHAEMAIEAERAENQKLQKRLMRPTRFTS